MQIAAVCGEKSLNIYLKPNGRISESASKVTGLTYENGILKRLGQPLVSVSADEGLKQFIMFLASSYKPFLIGHNIQNFDVPILITIYKNIILSIVFRMRFPVLLTHTNFQRKCLKSQV